MYKLAPHQIAFSKKLLQVLQKYNIVYLHGEVRSGKTGTALNAVKLFGAQNVLILTKKNAISSIEEQYQNFGFTYKLTVMNYESVHKLNPKDFDFVIYDESHSLGAIKINKATKLCKKMFSHLPCILMTGTMAVETYSQLYHQFYVSDFSPFKEYKNFYKWAKEFVNVEKKHLATHIINDYTNAKIKEISKVIKPYKVVMTQQDAGFTTQIQEVYLNVETPKQLKNLANRLLKDKAVEGKRGFVLGDSPAKLQSKVHQLVNGHVIIETAEGETESIILSNYKAQFIREYFETKKIAILYYYQSELEILKKVFPHNLTTDLDEFDTSYYNIAIQQNTTEGMNLSKADALVYFNLGFSGKNFIQSRDRLTVRGRKENNVYFVCEDFGMTSNILKAVQKKENFNSREFLKVYNGKQATNKTH